MASGIGSAYTVFVVKKSFLKVVCYTRIETIVGTEKDIHIPHEGEYSRGQYICGGGSRGNQNLFTEVMGKLFTDYSATQARFQISFTRFSI